MKELFETRYSEKKQIDWVNELNQALESVPSPKTKDDKSKSKKIA